MDMQLNLAGFLKLHNNTHNIWKYLMDCLKNIPEGKFVVQALKTNQMLGWFCLFLFVYSFWIIFKEGDMEAKSLYWYVSLFCFV